jgi:hypothetical protein
LRHSILAFLSVVLPTSVVAAEDELPWAFQNGEAHGYSLEPVSADPLPGTPLCAGSERKFAVSVSYALTISTEGKVMLVFQDENNVQIAGRSPSQVSQTVSEGRGTVTLSETITIPRAKEVRVFVPLIPGGMEKTEGELVLRFPIKACE